MSVFADGLLPFSRSAPRPKGRAHSLAVEALADVMARADDEEVSAIRIELDFVRGHASVVLERADERLVGSLKRFP